MTWTKQSLMKASLNYYYRTDTYTKKNKKRNKMSTNDSNLCMALSIAGDYNYMTIMMTHRNRSTWNEGDILQSVWIAADENRGELACRLYGSPALNKIRENNRQQEAPKHFGMGNNRPIARKNRRYAPQLVGESKSYSGKRELFEIILGGVKASQHHHHVWSALA